MRTWIKAVLLLVLIGFVGGMIISAYGSVTGNVFAYSYFGAIFTFIMILIAGTILVLHFIRWGNRWMRG